jgi:hypothetical protein
VNAIAAVTLDDTRAGVRDPGDVGHPAFPAPPVEERP